MRITTGDAVEKAQDYYNSSPADRFYFKIWGGEHIHVGIYHEKDEPIKLASPRIVNIMASQLDLDPSTEVLDLGSGYGGAARFLAKTYGCKVTCLNLSSTQNARNEASNREQGLDHLITVVEGNFEDICLPDNSFDVVWSQDAIVHSADRERVLEEVWRVLREEGNFIFTDLMQTDDCPDGVLKPVLDRIHLDSLGSFGFYLETVRKLGLKRAEITELSEHLTTHYDRVLQETERNYDYMVSLCGKEYIDKMIKGLKHWVDAGNNDYLAWGVMNFEKSAA